MKRFVPNRYVNSISFREPRCTGHAGMVEASFETWNEAHMVLIESRRTELEYAEKALKASVRRLKKAHAMKPPAQRMYAPSVSA